MPSLLAFDFACEVVLIEEEKRLCVGVQLWPALWGGLGVCWQLTKKMRLNRKYRDVI
jgi:hypothetical protein